MAAKRAGGAAPAVSGDAVALSYYAPNGSAASYTSNGVPLRSGVLTAANFAAGYGRVEVNGVEVAMYTEALSGKHADNSLRTVLVQCAKSDVQSGTVLFYPSRLRTVSPRTKQTVTRSYLSAPLALLPSSVSYLCATDMVLSPLVPATLVSSLSSDINGYYTGVKAYADAAWTANGVVAVPGPGGACYDHALCFAMLWCMTGDNSYWWKAVQIADAMTDIATPTDSVANLGDYTGLAWSMNIPNVPTTLVESMAWFYKATGHPQPRQSILARAAFETTQFVVADYDLRAGSLDIATPEPRTALARYNAAWMAAHLEASTSTAYYDVLTFNAASYVTAFLTYCQTALRPAASPGAWLAGIAHSDKDSITGGPIVGNGNYPNFQTGYASRVWIQTYRYANAYANIPTWIASHCAHITASVKPVDPSEPSYVAGQLTAKYESVDPSTLGSTIATENDCILSPMYSMQHAWRAYTANSSTEDTQARAMLKTVHVVGSGTSYKLVGEQCLYALPAMGYLALRAGLI